MSASSFTADFHTVTQGKYSRKIAYSRIGEISASNFFICLPGLLETRESFDGLFSLVENYSDACWLSIDYCGRGLSDPLSNDESYTISQYVKDVENLIEKTVLQPATHAQKKIHLIGTSMGGILAMHMANRNRFPLHGIVLNDIGLYLQWNALLSLYQHIKLTEDEINQLVVDPRAIEAVQKRTHFDLPYDFDLTGMRFENLLKHHGGQVVLLHNSHSFICPTSIAIHSKTLLNHLVVWSEENHGHPVKWNKIWVNKLAQCTQLVSKPIDVMMQDPTALFLAEQEAIDIRSNAERVLLITKHAFLEQPIQNWVLGFLNKLRCWRRRFS